MKHAPDHRRGARRDENRTVLQLRAMNRWSTHRTTDAEHDEMRTERYCNSGRWIDEARTGPQTRSTTRWEQTRTAPPDGWLLKQTPNHNKDRIAWIAPQHWKSNRWVELPGTFIGCRTLHVERVDVESVTKTSQSQVVGSRTATKHLRSVHVPNNHFDALWMLFWM
jgi:hypothetical protein